MNKSLYAKNLIDTLLTTHSCVYYKMISCIINTRYRGCTFIFLLSDNPLSATQAPIAPVSTSTAFIAQQIDTSANIFFSFWNFNAGNVRWQTY